MHSEHVARRTWGNDRGGNLAQRPRSRKAYLGERLQEGRNQHGTERHMGRDSIYVNGKIITVDGADSVAEALAVKGDKILAVGSDSESGIWPASRPR